MVTQHLVGPERDSLFPNLLGSAKVGRVRRALGQPDMRFVKGLL